MTCELSGCTKYHRQLMAQYSFLISVQFILDTQEMYIEQLQLWAVADTGGGGGGRGPGPPGKKKGFVLKKATQKCSSPLPPIP